MRRLLSGLGLLCLAAGSVFAVRGTQKPYLPSAPQYRQLGPADAPVVIAEFADFQCPSCHRAVEPLKQLESMFPGKIRVVFKHLPWERPHPKARSAALAAECAGKQGKFWKMHDLLHGRWEEWVSGENSDALFASYAGLIGLDAAAYEKCRADPATAQAISADVADAESHFVGSTPTFFVNGKRLVGGPQLRSQGLAIIEKAVKR